MLNEGLRIVQAGLECVVEHCKKWVVLNKRLDDGKMLKMIFHEARYCVLSVFVQHVMYFNSLLLKCLMFLMTGKCWPCGFAYFVNLQV